MLTCAAAENNNIEFAQGATLKYHFYLESEMLLSSIYLLSSCSGIDESIIFSLKAPNCCCPIVLQSITWLDVGPPYMVVQFSCFKYPMRWQANAINHSNYLRQQACDSLKANDLVGKQSLLLDRVSEWLIGWLTFLGYYVMYRQEDVSDDSLQSRIFVIALNSNYMFHCLVCSPMSNSVHKMF